jgi:hypothetical protein
MAAAALGTFLTTFMTTLNNHSVAAFGVVFALYPVFDILTEPRPSGSGHATAPSRSEPRPSGSGHATAPSRSRLGFPRLRFFLAGLFAAWAACNELPAAAFGLALFGLLLWRAPRQTLLYFVPAALVPIAGFLFTNYLAVGDLIPVQVRFGSAWYRYPGSHWLAPRGIDGATDPLGFYAFHLLLGHHGIFALSPVFVLALLGMLGVWNKGRSQVLSWLALILTLIVFGFYLVKSNNYGGWTSGPRWFFWLIPLWLLVMLPAADWLGRSRAGRGLGYVLLAWSALSVSYPAWNPWRHPWLFNWLEDLGVIRY